MQDSYFVKTCKAANSVSELVLFIKIQNEFYSFLIEAIGEGQGTSAEEKRDLEDDTSTGEKDHKHGLTDLVCRYIVLYLAI